MASLLADLQSERGYWASLFDISEMPNVWLTSHIVYFCKDVNIRSLRKSIKRASKWLYEYLKSQLARPRPTNEFLQKVALIFIALDFRVSDNIKFKFSSLAYKTSDEHICWFNDILTSSLVIITLLNIEGYLSRELRQIIRRYIYWVYDRITKAESLEESKLYWITVALKQIYNKERDIDRKTLKQTLLELSNRCETLIRKLDENTALDRKLWLFLLLYEFANSKGILNENKIKLLKDLLNDVSKEIDQMARDISDWFPNVLREFIHNTYEQIYRSDISERKYVQINIPVDSIYRYLPPDLTSIALLIKLLFVLKNYIVCVVTRKDYEEFKNKTTWCRRILIALSALVYILSSLLLSLPNKLSIISKILEIIILSSSILLTISIRTNLEDISVRELLRDYWNIIIVLLLTILGSIFVLTESLKKLIYSFLK